MNISLDSLWKDESRRFHLLMKFYKLKYRVEWKIDAIKRRVKAKFPILINEGEATARLIDQTFDGYPFIEDYTLEEATNQLRSIWNIIDNWDGSRVNVSEILESK